MFSLKHSTRAQLLAATFGCVLLCALLVSVLVSRSSATDAQDPIDSFSVLSSSNAKGLAAMPSHVQSRVENLSRSPQLAQAPSKVGLAEFSNGQQVAVALIGELICAQGIESGLATCGFPSVAASGGTFSAAPVGCDGYEVVGLMPDGVDRLLVDRHGNGSVDNQIPVQSNVYSATLKPVSTVLMSVDRKVRVELPLGWYAADNEAC